MHDPDLADRMEDMEPQFWALLQDVVTSFPKWDILRFFVELGIESAPLDEIAEAVGREPAALLGEAADLVRGGMLGRRTVDGTTHYVITQESRRRTQLEAFLAATRDRDFRLKVIYHLLHRD